jgi:ATP-dependent RNA helicase RhlE
MRFSEYSIANEIKEQLDELGFKRPTDIQFKAIKPILDGEDVFAIAQTGTGKTGAFVIPIVNELFRKTWKRKEPRAIVMAPTRELAEQITQVFEQIAKKTTLNILCVMGGITQDDQINQLKKGVDIIIATPGRVFDLRSQGYLSLDYIQFLVLDEADRMLDLGFANDINAIHKLSPNKNRQTLFFSATITKKIKALAYDIVREAIRIQISPKNPVSRNVAHAYLAVSMDDKRFFLENMIKEYEEYKFVVFVRTKVRCERVVAAMERVGIHSEALHGGKEQVDRFAILERFRNNENKILITTDVAARGIDIPNVDVVINYDLPDQEEQYVHRVGRTGRGDKDGQAISFCSPEEKPLLEAIETYIGYPVEQLEIHEDDYKTILRDSEDLSYNWKKLLDEANEEDGTKDSW